MNEQERLAAYCTARNYGRVVSDYHADARTRLMVIEHDGKLYKAALHLGQVFALTIEG